MRKVYVQGASSSPYGRFDFSLREKGAEVALEALDSAQLTPEDVQVAFVSNALGGLVERQGHLGPILMTALGAPHVPSLTIESACSSGSAAFREAFLNVASGAVDVALVVGIERVSTLDTLTATSYFCLGSDFLLEGACGATFPGLYATMARAHMETYGTTSEELASVAVKNHDHALSNPKAHFRKKITTGDVLESPLVCHPLRLYDCCPFSDGASAVVLVSEEIARRKDPPRIRVAGSARAASPASLVDREDLTTLPATRRASREALRMAGIEIWDVDFFELHDCFTIAEIIATEDVGLFPPGEGGKAALEGRTKSTGEFPVNLSGGLKAKGHPVGATGVGQIVECFERLLGTAPPPLPEDPHFALAHNVGATGGSVSVHILEKEG